MAKQVPSGNKQNSGTLTRPAKGETMNPKGRPPKLVTDVINELKAKGYKRVTTTDIAETYETLLNLSQEELVAKGQDVKAPMIVRILVKAMLSPRGFEIIEAMIDRAHGKASQTLNQTLSVKEQPLFNLPKKK